MKTQSYQKQKSMYFFVGKLLIIITMVFLTIGFSRAQNLYIRSTGDTGPTSGTNWAISGGVLTVSGGTANVNASVITNYLQNTGSLKLTAPGTIYIYQDIIPSLFNYQLRNLTIAANGTVQVGYTDNGRTIRSAIGGNPLDIVLWSDADGNQDGRIVLYEGSQLITNNGHLWMGGGGSSTYWNSLQVGNSYAAAAGSAFYGINLQGATINAGTGNIWMNGKSFNTSGNNRYGVRISDYDEIFFSNITCANLDITGVGSASTGSYGNHDGVSINGGSTVTVSGHLNITGTGGGGNSTGGYSYGITISSSNVTVTGNELLYFRGTGGGGSAGNNYGVAINNGSVVTVNSGDIDIVGFTGTATTLGFVMAGASALKCGSTGTGSGRVRIVADDIDFGDALSYISSAGLLSLETCTNFATIRVGSGTGGTLKLSSSFFTNNFSSNFSNIYIGGDFSGNIAISDAPFRSPVIFKGAAGTLLQPSVNVNITGKTLTLGDNVTLNESNGVLYGTSGTITATRMLVSPSSVNVAGLGAIISSPYTLGSTIITRGHTAQSGLVNGASGIARYYDIAPYSNSGLSATLVFNYSGQDVNSLNEDAFGLFKSINGGVSYTKQNGTPNAANNTVTLSGITSFSRWTVGESCLNPATAGTISSSHTICYNSTATTLTGTAPTGYFGDLEYNWQQSTMSSSAGFTFITGATGSSYNPGALTQTTWFKRLAKTTCADVWPASGTSNVVEVTVRSQFTSGTISSTGESICFNTSPGTAIGNVTAASGGDGTIAYSWRSSADSYTNAIAGATNSTYTPTGPLTAQQSYRRYANDGACTTTPSVSTGTWTVSIRSPFTAGAIQTTGQTICYNTTASTIGNLTAASGGNNNITYKWQSSANGSFTDSVTIAGATSSSYDPGSLTSTTTFRRMAKDGACNTTFAISTGTWTVTVQPQFTAGAILTTGETINYNEDPSLIGNQTAASGGDGNLTYKWQLSITNGSSGFVDILSSTETSYNPPAGLTVTTWYRRLANDGTCNTTPATSTGVWLVTVLSPAVNTTAITSVTSGSAMSGGENIDDLNATITAKGIVWNSTPAPTTALTTKTSETVVAGSEDADFPSALTGLSPNAKYYTRAYIVNSYGTFYGNEYEFITMANVPALPVVNNPATTSLDVAIDGNSNPGITQFSIYETHTGKWVQTNGTLGNTAVWQTEIQWEVNGGNQAKTVTGLLENSLYSFKVKARNSNDVESGFGMADSLYTLAAIPDAPVTSGKTNQSVDVAIFDTVNPAITEYSVYETGTSRYLQADGTLGADTVFNTKAAWHTDAGNSAKTVTGLSPDSLYIFYVTGRNGNLVKTIHGETDTIRTMANVPSPPVVINPTATSLDVSVVTNGNPDHTRYAIQDSVNSLFVQANGTRGASPVWQTDAEWDTITVTGLETGTMYYFRVMAKNLEDETTVYGMATGRNTCSNPTDGGTISDHQEICYGSTPEALVNVSHASNYGGIREYQWQSSTTSDSEGFSDIAGADTAGYAPGVLTDTTWYRRLSRVSCKPDWEGATPSNVVKITVDPTTDAGAITGDTLVCYGSHSSVLALNDYTGSVLKWQYSTDNSNWNDIASSSSPTHISENLIVDTWYRAVVQSGVCLVENSPSHKVSVFTNYKISGYAKYENNPKTPLNGLKVLLRKGTVIVDSTVTSNTGYYEFDNLTNGNFGLIVKSAHPSGLWQTWGGVNNTDYLLVSKHIAGTQFLPVNPPVIQVTASTKAPHPTINNLDATAIRQAAKFPLTGYSYFDIPKWVFSGTTTVTRIDTFELACDDVTRDIRGLCAGDVNGTYVPALGYKTAVETLHATSLQLEHHGNLQLTDEMIFPIRVDRDMELGAMTLYLDFDPSVMIVTEVTMPENSGAEPWFNVKGLMFNVEDPTLNLKPETLNLESPPKRGFYYKT